MGFQFVSSLIPSQTLTTDASVIILLPVTIFTCREGSVPRQDRGRIEVSRVRYVCKTTNDNLSNTCNDCFLCSPCFFGLAA